MSPIRRPFAAMREHRRASQRTTLPRRPVRAFTLVELMVVVAIVAILAAVAWPSYSAHLQRGRVIEAVTRLSDARAKMEQYFLDQRAYVDASGACGVAAPPVTPGDAFALACTATPSTYTYTATGASGGGMAGFAYSIDQSGLRATVAVPAAWTRRSECWTIRPDGLCL